MDQVCILVKKKAFSTSNAKNSLLAHQCYLWNYMDFISSSWADEIWQATLSSLKTRKETKDTLQMSTSRTNSWSGPAKLASNTAASQHCVHNHQDVHQEGLFMHQTLQKSSLWFYSSPSVSQTQWGNARGWEHKLTSRLIASDLVAQLGWIFAELMSVFGNK